MRKSRSRWHGPPPPRPGRDHDLLDLAALDHGDRQGPDPEIQALRALLIRTNAIGGNMNKIARYLALAALAFLLVFSAAADEGMWMPHQMKDLNLKALGLQMDPGDLYKMDGTGLMSAVVNLGGGTGEFVSAAGP